MTKDRQVELGGAQNSIPIISPLLHCVAMSVVVLLRSGFGYAYLRPKSIFISCAWAFALFSVYAWFTPSIWREFGGLCCFGIAASALYLLHLSWAFWTELRGSATHDHDSGVPHTLRILRLLGAELSEDFRAFWVIWVEPGVVVLFGVLEHWRGLDGKYLSYWLLLAGSCLWLKEALNYWFHIRQRKRQHDTLDDAEDNLEATHLDELDLPAASRKAKVIRQRIR